MGAPVITPHLAKQKILPSAMWKLQLCPESMWWSWGQPLLRHQAGLAFRSGTVANNMHCKSPLSPQLHPL